MGQIILGDCLQVLPTLPPQSVDLVFGSPPYEDARTYGIGFNLKGQAWVDWMVQVYKESLRVCRGLVAFVVEGRTRKFSYSGTPLLLGADLLRAGVTLRKPPIYGREGIPGSGGPDWLKNKYEFIVCATNGGKLPWSDNIVMGHPPKCGLGGPMSNRDQKGERLFNKQTRREPNGSRDNYAPSRPMPQIANPGNIIWCGADTHLGSIAHENEAPFPEKLAESMIRSFCPPGGTVLDPFGGSGTTAAVAEKHGRKWITIDIRQSEIDRIQRRLLEVYGVPPVPTVGANDARA